MIHFVMEKWHNHSLEEMVCIAKDKKSAIKYVDFMCENMEQQLRYGQAIQKRTYYVKRINPTMIGCRMRGIIFPDDTTDFDYVYERTIGEEL